MRVAVCLLSLAAACLAAPPVSPAAHDAPPRVSAVQAADPPRPAAPPAPAAAAGSPQRKDGVSALEGDDAPADDLKTDATFWGGWGWGYPRYYVRPRYYSTYSVPYTYSAPYWGGWSGWKSYGWNSYW